MFDLEMIKEVGYCQGIENYSRHLTNRLENEPPPTLLDYFPSDSLFMIDESHATIPQLNGMYRGDRSRKEKLIRYGFRLPSAFDNRPLKFEEFKNHAKQVIYVSATPAQYELEESKNNIIELIVRPTGLVDPTVTIQPIKEQVDDLFKEIKLRAKKNQRTLVTTLTKRFSEDLTEHYTELGLRVKYLHSDIETLERIHIIRELRLGEFDALIGINLLREGLDIPEVSLVAILDADKEGFLRSTTSLIQTSGRAARNIDGKVIFYADTITQSMKKAIDEMNRRRIIQTEYNATNQIIPESIKKSIQEVLVKQDKQATTTIVENEEDEHFSRKDAPKLIKNLEKKNARRSKKSRIRKSRRTKRPNKKNTRKRLIYYNLIHLYFILIQFNSFRRWVMRKISF